MKLKNNEMCYATECDATDGAKTENWKLFNMKDQLLQVLYLLQTSDSSSSFAWSAHMLTLHTRPFPPSAVVAVYGSIPRSTSRTSESPAANWAA